MVTAPARAHKDVLAEKILAAIVADDFEQLRPLFRVPGVDRKTADDLADVNSDSIRKLRSKLEELSVDPKALKIVRVEGEAGMQVEMYDVFLDGGGKHLKTHFSTNGTGYLLGVANWIVPADGVSNN